MNFLMKFQQPTYRLVGHVGFSFRRSSYAAYELSLRRDQILRNVSKT